MSCKLRVHFSLRLQENRIRTIAKKNPGPEADELLDALNNINIMAMVVGTSEAGGKITPKFQLRNFGDVPPGGPAWPFNTRTTLGGSR
jgi:hypothetical protein